MFGIIVYIGAVSFISGFITFMWVITRPVKHRGEIRSWRIWIATFLVCAFLPYAAFEVQTHMLEASLKDVVQDAADFEGVEGDVVYYKVLFYDGTSAHVTIVGEEMTSWGGTDHLVIRAKFRREGKGWSVAYTNMVYSDNRNIDGVVFPPFW